MTNIEIKTKNQPKKRAANIQVDKPRTFEGHPFKVQDLRGFFPKNYTQKQMTDTILKLLYDYNRKLERSRRSRDER